MHKLYRSAIDGIQPPPQLQQKTAADMRAVSMRKRSLRQLNVSSAAGSSALRRVIGVGSWTMVVSIMIVLVVWFMEKPDDQSGWLASELPQNVEQTLLAEVPSSAEQALPQIARYYVPFQASQYQSVKAPYPRYPMTYEELKGESDVIVLVTVEEAGVYREKSQAYHPRASFGTYIYSVKVEQVLEGKLHGSTVEGVRESENVQIAIIEQAWAMLSGNSDAGEPQWSFTPYTARADAARPVERGQQYVMFLRAEDERGFHPVTSNGFGLFPLSYIQREAEQHSVRQMEQLYHEELEKTSKPMQDDLLYRLFSVYIYDEFWR